MRTALQVVCLLVLGLAASGCIRLDFDLCLEDPPHPDCLDAGVDAGPPNDAGSTDAGPNDAGDNDAGTDAGAADAGPGDAGADDAGADDAGADDAGGSDSGASDAGASTDAGP